LGELHDLDVLSATIDEVAAGLEEVRASWAERITRERHERIETYRGLAIGEGGLWQIWRRGLPEGNRLEAASQARLRVTARALEANPGRATLIFRLAMKLFGALTRVQASPALVNRDVKKIMRASARLHGIGEGLDADSPQKAARKYLRAMTLPPGWTETEWEILANAVRYQRGGLPQARNKGFARFTPEEQKTICTLAGVLRMARVLRRCGVASAVGLRVEQSVDALILRVPGIEESEESAARLAAGKYLLENSLDRPVIVKAAPQILKVVQLPRKEEGPPPSAVASD